MEHVNFTWAQVSDISLNIFSLSLSLLHPSASLSLSFSLPLFSWSLLDLSLLHLAVSTEGHLVLFLDICICNSPTECVCVGHNILAGMCLMSSLWCNVPVFNPACCLHLTLYYTLLKCVMISWPIFVWRKEGFPMAGTSLVVLGILLWVCLVVFMCLL